MDAYRATTQTFINLLRKTLLVVFSGLLLALTSLMIGCKLGGDVTTYYSALEPVSATAIPLDMRIAKPPFTAPRLPDGRSPAMILVHGGAWQQGRYDNLGMLFQQIGALNQGYVTASINYRLTDQQHPDGSIKHPWPAQIQDVKCAIRWLKAHAGPGENQYNIDPDRVVIMGVSAGGHLALMAGETPGMKQFESSDCPFQDVDSSVAAVVSFVGVADVATYWAEGGGKDPVQRLLASDAPTKTALSKASPTHYVKPGGVPVLQMHSRDDEIVPCTAALYLHRRLVAEGRDSHLEVYPSGGHDMAGFQGYATMMMYQWLNDKIWEKSTFQSPIQEQPSC